MTQKNSLNFHLSLKKNLVDSPREKNSKNSILLVRQMINSICGIFSDKDSFSDITFSIRYLKEINLDSAQVKTYFVIERLNNHFSLKEIEIIEANIGATLGKIFNFSSCQFDWQNLTHINTISEIIKHEIFDIENKLYIPKFLKTASLTDLESVLDYMDSLDSKIVLEICLQPYHQPDEQKRWMAAIDEMIQSIQANLQQNILSKAILNKALLEYQAYQTYYSSDTTLFNYSIRAYGEKQSHIQALLNSFKNVAISPENTTDCTVVSVSQQSHALVLGKVGGIERSEWRNTALTSIPISRLNQPDKKGWGKFGNNSLNVDNFFESTISWKQVMAGNQQQQVSSQGQNQSSPTNQNQIVLSTGSGQITKTSGSEKMAIADLKPLHRLVCLEEIQGFLGLGISSKIQVSYPTMTAEEIFDKYRYLITPDTYIVGLDDNGKPVTSSWDDIPHRLVAGETGWGKTNFMQWIIFQFSYANRAAKIYIMDFKKLDFPDLQSMLPHLNWNVITKVEEAMDMIDEIDRDQEERLQIIRKHPGARKISQLTKKGVPIHRTLWIIDEAAAVGRASSRLSEKIENKLAEYAQIGRSFGIHMIYGAQRPDTSIISKQVVDQLGEKTVFKVTYKASMEVLETGEAEHINTTGRAILHRGGSNWSFVNTPEMPDLFEYPLSDTIWNNI